jgi:3-deoxy-manno-octulosonate cytidylyltransferase (CMP-KDO synthetase)
LTATLVVIPARAGSQRLPMKPLRPIAGRTLLHRTIAAARAGLGTAELLVATDDARIAAHAKEVGCPAVLTDPAVASGSGRALAAARTYAPDAERIVNFQGDSPFLPPDALPAVLAALAEGAEVATPVVRLDWDALDALRRHKAVAPFSGTTCVRGADGRALWFSKAVLPAIRDEPALRGATPVSPVWRHVGLYGYTRDALECFEATPPTALERLEGLEQLRLLELGIAIRAVAVSPARFDISGIDTEADLVRAEALIAEHGDPCPAP